MYGDSIRVCTVYNLQCVRMCNMILFHYICLSEKQEYLVSGLVYLNIPGKWTGNTQVCEQVPLSPSRCDLLTELVTSFLTWGTIAKYHSQGPGAPR